MKKLICLIVTSFIVVVGCGNQKTAISFDAAQSKQIEQKASRNSATASYVKQTEMSNQLEIPKYTLSPLNGMRREEVIKVHGMPDDTNTWGTGDVIKSDDQLIWIYKNKPCSGFTTNLHFEPKFTPLIYREKNITPPLDKVQQTIVDNSGNNPFDGPKILAKQVVPGEFFKLRPDEYYVGDDKYLVNGNMQPVSFLALVWLQNDRTIIIKIGQVGESFRIQNKKMNLSTGEYEYRYDVAASAHNWRDKLLVQFAVYSGPVKFAYTCPMGDVNLSGYCKIKNPAVAALSDLTSCAGNLQQIRMAIQMATQKPHSLSDLTNKNPTLQMTCPVGGELYKYDPSTGQIGCVHPGHQKL